MALFLQTLPPATGIAVAAASFPVPQQATSPTTPLPDNPVAESLPPMTADEPSTTTSVTPVLPAAAMLDLDRTLLTVGATAAFTITVQGQPAAPVDGMTLTLTLPPGLMTSDGAAGALVWLVPSLPEDTTFVQVIHLQLDQATLPAPTAVAALVVTLTAPGYLTGYWYNTLGLALSTGSDEPVQTVQQGSDGAVLQAGAGFLTLFAEAEAADVATTFTYTELYRWDREPVTTTTPITTSDGALQGDTPLTLTLDSILTSAIAVALPVTATAAITPDRVSNYHTLLPLVENNRQPADGVVQAQAVTTVTSDEPKKPRPKQYVAHQYG